jgi:hypothetical protein
VCLGIIAAQQAQIAELRQAATPGSSEPEVTTSQANSTEALETMQSVRSANISDNEAEISRLKALVAKFTKEVETLEARVQKQRSQALTANQDFLTAEELAPLEQARTNALRIVCVNNLKQFGLAAKVWALDNNDTTPPSVLSMSNELSSPKILVCPADTARQPATDWGTFSMANCSYEYIGQSAPDADPERVLARCPIHNNVCLFDGSVQSEVDPGQLSYRDGKMYLNINRQSPESRIAPANGAGTPQPANDASAEERFRRRYGLSPQPTTTNPKAE